MNRPKTPDNRGGRQMIQPDQFFIQLLPHFQNFPQNLLAYFFENRPSVQKIDFLNKCTNLNLFQKDQILYIYSKLDTTFSGKIDRTQIELFFNYSNPQMSKQNNPQPLSTMSYNYNQTIANPSNNYYQNSQNQQSNPHYQDPYQGGQYSNRMQEPGPSLIQTQIINSQTSEIRNPLGS